jgi:hypothetical protein
MVTIPKRRARRQTARGRIAERWTAWWEQPSSVVHGELHRLALQQTFSKGPGAGVIRELL